MIQISALHVSYKHIWEITFRHKWAFGPWFRLTWAIHFKLMRHTCWCCIYICRKLGTYKKYMQNIRPSYAQNTGCIYVTSIFHFTLEVSTLDAKNNACINSHPGRSYPSTDASSRYRYEYDTWEVTNPFAM